MKKFQVEKRKITLIEMMVVMFLIMLIMGVVAFNVRGSLEEGKAFKTREGIEKLSSIVELELMQEPELIDHLDENWKSLVARSSLTKNPASLVKDGWGVDYEIKVDADEENFEFTSKRYTAYLEKNGSLAKTL